KRSRSVDRATLKLGDGSMGRLGPGVICMTQLEGEPTKVGSAADNRLIGFARVNRHRAAMSASSWREPLSARTILMTMALLAGVAFIGFVICPIGSLLQGLRPGPPGDRP